MAREWSDFPHEYLGCGTIALVSQLDYLARFAGYKSICSDPDNEVEATLLRTAVLDDIDAFGSEDWQWLPELLPFITITEGTLVLPIDFVRTANFILYESKLKMIEEVLNEEGEVINHNYTDGQIGVHLIDGLDGGAYNNIWRIKESIDKGMPVVWWTGNSAGAYGGHYMNIYAYETWESTNSSGQQKSHLVFRIRRNFNEIDDIVFADSDVMQASCGLVLFEEMSRNVLVTHSDYHYEMQYFFEQRTLPVTAWNYTFSTKRYRCGHITYLGESFIVLSAKRENAGLAYLEYGFNHYVKGITIDISFWSSAELIYSYNSTIELQYMLDNYHWVTLYDFYDSHPRISTIRQYPTRFFFPFPAETKDFRFIVTAPATGADVNKGRIVIGNLNVFLDV